VATPVLCPGTLASGGVCRAAGARPVDTGPETADWPAPSAAARPDCRNSAGTQDVTPHRPTIITGARGRRRPPPLPYSSLRGDFPGHTSVKAEPGSTAEVSPRRGTGPCRGATVGSASG